MALRRSNIDRDRLCDTMEGKSGSMNYWRRFFRSTEADVFEVIEWAIMVAALDFPTEFRRRRDGIAEKLFSCRVSRCFGCSNMELLVPDAGEDLRVEEGGASVKWEVIENGSKIDGCNDEHDGLTRARLSNYSYDEAEALTEVMDEENHMTKEVYRLKEVLLHNHDQSEAVIFESLRRLQLMHLSVETLKATEIGRSVNDLRKHSSKQIGRLARTLIGGWKEMVDEWVQTAAAVTERYPNSADPAQLAEEDGLPSPPMDEGALLATQSTSIMLSEIFDGIDDNGNFLPSGDTLKPVPESRGSSRWPEPPRQPVVSRQAKPLSALVAPPKPQGTINNSSKPSIAASGSGKPPIRPTYEQKPNDGVSVVQRKPSNIPMDVSSFTIYYTIKFGNDTLIDWFIMVR